jgi:Protein of unknown function (DUF2510)
MSFIEINPTHGTLSFGAEIVKPKVRIDGGPELVLPAWRPARIPVAPGPHRVELWMVWGLIKKYGHSSVDVQVPPEGVRVSWKTPGSAITKAKVALELPGAGPFDQVDPTGQAYVATNPAAWHPDPSGRHQYRWWDGNAWTASVSDNGMVTEDAP